MRRLKFDYTIKQWLNIPDSCTQPKQPRTLLKHSSGAPHPGFRNCDLKKQVTLLALCVRGCQKRDEGNHPYLQHRGSPWILKYCTLKQLKMYRNETKIDVSEIDKKNLIVWVVPSSLVKGDSHYKQYKQHFWNTWCTYCSRVTSPIIVDYRIPQISTVLCRYESLILKSPIAADVWIYYKFPPKHLPVHLSTPHDGVTDF